MLDVGEDKLLVLLLMVQAQGDGTLQACIRANLLHGRVDMGAIGKNLVQAGTGQHSAARPGMPGTQSLVIGIEQIGETWIEPLVTGPASQDRGLEEPAGVRQMPFHGTGIGHGLDGAVLRRKSSRQRQAMGTHRGIGLGKGGGQQNGGFHLWSLRQARR